MRPLSLALSILAMLFVLGCGPSNDKPIPVNTEGGGGAPAAQATPPAATPADTPADTTADASGQHDMAASIAQHDEAFKNALGSLAEAAQQDIAMAAEMQTAEAAAMEKLGGALAAEVAEREKQAMQVAGEVIKSLKAKGFDVTANIVELDKANVPEAAQALVSSLEVGQTSKVFEWNGGYGVIRKMAETDTTVKVGYIWATKEAAMGPGGVATPAAEGGH